MRPPSSRWWGTKSKWRNDRSARSEGSFGHAKRLRIPHKFCRFDSTRLDSTRFDSGATRGTRRLVLGKDAPPEKRCPRGSSRSSCGWRRPLYRLPFRQPIFKMARGGNPVEIQTARSSNHIPAWTPPRCFPRVSRERRLSFSPTR